MAADEARNARHCVPRRRWLTPIHIQYALSTAGRKMVVNRGVRVRMSLLTVFFARVGYPALQSAECNATQDWTKLRLQQ